jgi:hypothetical protein
VGSLDKQGGIQYIRITVFDIDFEKYRKLERWHSGNMEFPLSRPVVLLSDEKDGKEGGRKSLFLTARME